ncbi:hypothetical protein [Stieleria varia]|uniref:Uncharacterized protein n=1 Tax=Stieleria varia TaxID=2528005 RepID=A0A5C6AZL0_9BACT|nr:hypothetical protein [Stieleria varia]TWU04552.1 hypothetical protein Pla52n_25940 [Stieleria varia]
MRHAIAIVGLMALMGASHCIAQDAKISTTADSLLATLKRPCKFDLSSASLNDVAVAVRKQFNVNVIVQDHAFEQIGLEDVRVTYRAEGVSLRSALLSMLDEFDATFAIRWESIVLTTNERADEYWRPAVYAVTDLVSVEPIQPQSPDITGPLYRSAFADFDSLIQLIHTFAAPDTWSAGTGPSSDCIGITVGDTHLLVVSQSESTHAEIERLLTDMRSKIAKRKTQDTEQ